MKRLSVAVLVATLTLGVFTATAAYANHFWKVDLSQPFSSNNGVSNRKTFNLEYKVLSTSNAAGDDYTVSIRQNGSQIATDTIPAGGDSSSTRVTVNSDGTYKYSIIVTSNLHSTNKTAGPVTVDVDTTPPVEANYGQKSQSGNQHTVTFTVTDPDAEQVNIYSSTSTSFTANSNTRVGQVTATGDQQSFTYTATAAERYHAVQVVDDAGNVSPLVGDPDADVAFVPPQQDTTTTATPASTGGGATTTGQTGDESVTVNENGEVISEDGEILGAQDGEEAASDEEQQSPDDDGETLGVADGEGESSNLGWYILTTVLVVFLGYYLWTKNSIRSNIEQIFNS